MTQINKTEPHKELGETTSNSRQERQNNGFLDIATGWVNTIFHQNSMTQKKKFFRISANKLAFLLTISSIISCVATYAAFTETPPFGDDPNTVIWLLNLDLVLLLLLVSLIARRIVSIWSGRRRNIAGSKFHVRLVFIFSLLTALPAIIMTIFSAYFLQFGVHSWFSERVRTAVTESQAVAESYLEEHRQIIRADILAMANDIDRHTSLLVENPQAFESIMQNQSLFRNLSESIVFDTSGRILAKSGLSFSLPVETIPDYAMTQAIEGEVVVMTGGSDNRVYALVKLRNMIGGYLFVGRMVDPTVLGHLADTKQAVQEYIQLENERSGLQLTITMIFLVVALLLVFAAIWLGIAMARQIVTPISALISAADRVRSGDLTARVPDFETKDEFDVLGRAFNKMTSQIQDQRNELVDANRQLDDRRRFTETVLAGVSSGVVGLDAEGVITLANNSASNLFQTDGRDMTGRNIVTVLPDILDILNKAYKKPEKTYQTEIPLLREDGSRRTLLMRVSVDLASNNDENSEKAISGTVLTFDDISDLQAAQRKAAWADVARRIAHEIKNPLTPIQLSAERLKRKYLKQIEVDPETFAKCTDTIIHHVGDIGRMVNEFSAFARMPEPKLKRNKTGRHLQDLIVMQREAHHKMKFETIFENENLRDIETFCDINQIRQAFTNIIQNAVDSIESNQAELLQGGVSKDDLETGHIRIFMHQGKDSENLYVSVSDNGAGLPKETDVEHLTEPYVTHKAKGTGLGLAIVKKIMDDHNGKIILGVTDQLKDTDNWQDLGGATITLVIPLYVNEDVMHKDADSDTGNLAATG